ncbi:hypothetical protein IL306_008840 [Fusarium sp. DS 682]|nr:hypothetical protein IL306_008840 [Fusarium sp. DS 682]
MRRAQRRKKRQRKEEEEIFLARTQLIIDQANFKGSWRRSRDFLTYESQGRNGGTADIICGCDPSPRTAWRHNREYWLEMNPARALVETDNPDDPNRERPKRQKDGKLPPKSKKKPVQFCRVFFLIHKSIPRDKWNVVYHDGANKDMAATLHLMTGDGAIAIHSVYNVNQPGKHIDIELLAKRTTTSTRDIVMGDFNLHNLTWSGPDLFKPGRESKAGQLLEDEMITKGNMALLTKQGTITCTAGQGNDHTTASCIDLTFVNPNLKSKVRHWGVFKDDPWGNSDHRPIRTIFDITPFRDETKVFEHNKVDHKVFATDVEQNMGPLIEAPLGKNEDMEDFASLIATLLLGSSH